MQGFKIYQEKLFNNFQLSNRVPEDNFYRQLKVALDLNFLYDQTRSYYGGSGQKSIDPVVFFKLCLVGYLENIISDRKLINHCSMRLDILYFLDYDIDESLPWHSTISRTRKLFPEAVFESVFVHVFKLCVEKGMVSGHTQANKVMHLSACAYNLKKYLKFIQKRTKSEAKEKVLYFLMRNGFINFIQVFLRPVYFGLKHYIFKNRLA